MTRTDDAEPSPTSLKATVALALTCVAGFVDAIGYLSLRHVYTANMSGNSVGFGFEWIHSPRRALEHGYPVLVFVIGVCLTGVILEESRRRTIRHALATTMAMEAVCLFLFGLLGRRYLGSAWSGQHVTGRAGFLLLVGLAALAMGIQNASVTRVGVMSIYTTHVTGSLTKMAEDAAACVLWLRDHLKGRSWPHRILVLRLLLRQPAFQRVFLLGGHWIVYVGGAAAGAFALRGLGFTAALLPLAVVLGIALLDLRRPIPVATAGKSPKFVPPP